MQTIGDTMASLSEDIYQAAFIPEIWTEVLDKVARAIGAEGAILANISNPDLPWFASDGVRDLYADFFAEGWAYDNAKTKALISTPHRGFISDADYLSEEWMGTQAIYRDFLWPRGFGYAAGTLVESPGLRSIGISVEKRRGAGPVTVQEIAFLDELRPHLSRAVVLANRLEFAKAEAALQALGMASIPAAIIGSDSKLLHANSLFEGFSGRLKTGARDILRLDGNPLLEKRFMAGQPQRGHSIPIKASLANPPAILHILPITGNARQFFLQAAAFVLITPATQNQLLTAELIKGLFDLTPTESRIAEQLVKGLVIAQIAAAEGSGVETIRTHVKAILAKAGMNSQREFLSAVNSIQPIAP